MSRAAASSRRRRAASPAGSARRPEEPGRWLTYSGDYTGQRHSPLTQITPDNVDRLAPQWTFQTETIARPRFETTPLVMDGVLYVTGANNYAWAIDARTGRQIWRYRRELPSTSRSGCGHRQPRVRRRSATGCSWRRSTRTCRARPEDRHGRSGTSCSRTTRRATRRHRRRSWSRTR